MARLIPSFMDERTPPGEREVFNMLSGGPDDWVALHSLDLTPWNRGLRTEIDFLIVAPNTGLLCVEVKSHENITLKNDRWSPSEIKRSPFKQASDGRHTLYRRLRELAPQFKTIPIVHCCIFPRARFDLSPNLSVQPWELIDSRTFRSFSNGHELCADLEARMRQSIRADGNLEPLAARLSTGQVETLVHYCLPVQKYRPSAREEIEHRTLEIERVLREQQKPVLQLAALNERLVVSGGAGTGKTLIAMEVARRASEKGLRVGLLCFNQLVGDWMKQRLEQGSNCPPNLIVGRAIRILSEMTSLKIPSDPSSQFWETELPEQLEERLTDPDFKATALFDYLVLDEAQDLLARPRLWDCLTRFLSGGLERGAFALFGDFENQVLGERDVMNQTLSALHATAKPAVWRLSENCRNYRIVGDSALRLSGFGTTVYTGYMRRGGGFPNYDIFFYGNEREQLDKLTEWLREFKTKGYHSSEITLLSFRTSEACAAVTLSGQGFKLRPAWQTGDSTNYTSVHKFKGMENKVVILTDVVLGDPDFHRHLFYTGMTRASEYVRVLCAKNCQDTLARWFTEKG